MLLLFSCIFLSSLHGYIISIRAGEAVPRGHVQVGVSHISFDEPESEDAWSLVLFELPVTVLSSDSAGPLVGLEEGLEDSCLCHLEPVLVSSVKLGIWSLPCVELCSLLASNSGG